MTVFSYKPHSFFVAATHKVTVPIFGNSCYDAQSSMVNSLGGIMPGIIVFDVNETLLQVSRLAPLFEIGRAHV